MNVESKGRITTEKTIIIYTNKFLKEQSIIVDRKLTSHSWRASLITNLLKIHSVNVVAELIGHKNLATTMLYKRGFLSLKEKIKKMKDFNIQNVI